MKYIAMIPARYAATRFPAKLMQDLCGKPVIVRTYEAVVRTGLFSEVYVVTDDDRIEKVIQEAGGKVIRSLKEHHSGSDRLAEAAKDLVADVIVNVQGDEPFTAKENLEELIRIFEEDKEEKVDVASLMEIITDAEVIANPNNVKVVVNKNNEALYFSRSVIPFERAAVGAPYYKHIGIYAYRKRALEEFTLLPASVLEETITNIPTIGIDTPEDLEEARKRQALEVF